MKLRYLMIGFLLAIGVVLLTGQGITEKITAGDNSRIADPDFRGKGAAQPLMNAFNET